MKNPETSFLGSLPPVTVMASGNSNVEMRYQVRIVIETREPDTLRRWAEHIRKKRLFVPVTE